MARTPVIAGNWKCNMRLDTAFELASGLRDRIDEIEGVEKIVCPPFIYLATVEVALSTSSILVGAQDVHWEDDVAATGEVGPKMLEELVDYVIIGHSERRHRFGETDEMVSKKVQAALATGLQPIMCVGETLEERQAGKTEDVLLRQTRGGLEGADAARWLYHRLRACMGDWHGHRGDRHRMLPTRSGLIRREVAAIVGSEKAETVRILYGGSVTGDNIAEFMSQDGHRWRAGRRREPEGRCVRRDRRKRGVCSRMNRLIAIVGPTASGKTTLAVELARRIRRRDHRRGLAAGLPPDGYRDREADSCQEQAAARHHLIDVVDPDEPFSLGQWLELAKESLDDIWARGKQPLLVGGTGQYVWALIEGWRVPEVPPQNGLRAEMESRAPDELIAELRRVDPEAETFIDPRNVRRVIRALEVQQTTGKPFSYWRTKDAPDFETHILGLRVPREELYRRIDTRVDAMVNAGFIDEVRGLLDAGYSRDLPSMSGIGYREMGEHLAGEITLDAAIERTKTGTHRLARHQNAWFKARDERIQWIDATESSISQAEALLRQEVGTR